VVTVSGECFEFLASQMINAETQWSLGTFGAIAEFMRDLDEPFTFQRGKASLTVTTVRGGMRIKPPAEMRLVAFRDADTGKLEQSRGALSAGTPVWHGQAHRSDRAWA
jgi:hypothetical protein